MAFVGDCFCWVNWVKGFGLLRLSWNANSSHAVMKLMMAAATEMGSVTDKEVFVEFVGRLATKQNGSFP